MEAFYLELRAVHITSIVLSGSIFLVRGLIRNVFDAPWVMANPLRYLSRTVDTALLVSAVALMLVIHQYPVQSGWLTVKVVLVFPYIALGYVALQGRARPVRLVCLVGALLIFGFIYSVARAHNPLGFLA